VANGHNHLLYHFVDFFVSFHFEPRLFVVSILNIHTFSIKSKQNIKKLCKIL
jgi:hypothetical protein